MSNSRQSQWTEGFAPITSTTPMTDCPTKGILEADVFHLKTNVLVLAAYYSPEDLMKVQYMDMNYI